MNVLQHYRMAGLAGLVMAALGGAAGLVLLGGGTGRDSAAAPLSPPVAEMLRPTHTQDLVWAPQTDFDFREAAEPDAASRLAMLAPDEEAQDWDEEFTEGEQEQDFETWTVEVDEATGARRAVREAARGSNPTSGPVTKRPRYTLEQRLAEIGPGAKLRLEQRFAAAKIAWPPAEVALVAIKDEKAIELYARAPGTAFTYVDRYKVLAASGKVGPKLAKGDKQVPEGLYRISFLNPNSAYHVSLRVNYPNAFDRQMAAQDKRSALGGDIMIHGKNVSAGCLAVGDPAAEELFVLAAEVGLKNVSLVIAPTDFRKLAAGQPVSAPADAPAWVAKLYAEIAAAMADYKPPPPPPGLLSLLGL